MIKLSTHEQKILNLIKENPEILIDPNARKHKKYSIQHHVS